MPQINGFMQQASEYVDEDFVEKEVEYLDHLEIELEDKKAKIRKTHEEI